MVTYDGLGDHGDNKSDLNVLYLKILEDKQEGMSSGQLHM